MVYCQTVNVKQSIAYTVYDIQMLFASNYQFMSPSINTMNHESCRGSAKNDFSLHICAVRHHHWPEHQSLVAVLVAMLSLHGPGCRVRGICATHCSCPQTWALASPQPGQTPSLGSSEVAPSESSH